MKKFVLILLTCVFSYLAECQTLQFTLADTTILAKKPAGLLHGISGIEYISSRNQWHLAADRGSYFIFDSISNIRDFEKRQYKAVHKKSVFWYEAVRFDPRTSTFVFAVENEYKPNKETNDTTTYVSYYDSFPSDFLIPPMPLPADNKGIEALAITDSGAVWVAPEAGWSGETEVGDDTIHFRKFDRKSTGYGSAASYQYVIDRSGCPLSATEQRGGISEILAINEKQLLVLERCYDEKGTKKIKARLWQVTVDGMQLRKEKNPAFDFNDHFPFKVDNLEGMSWWPAENGKRRLLLVTDDNPGLKNSQQTQFILLKEK